MRTTFQSSFLVDQLTDLDDFFLLGIVVFLFVAIKLTINVYAFKHMLSLFKLQQINCDH